MKTPARLLPLGLVGATAVASLSALAAPASAASSGTPVFRGQTSASVASLAVHIPGLTAALGLGDPITLQLIGADGGALQPLSGPATSTATSTLAGGSIVDNLLTGLGLSNSASLTNPAPAAKSLLSVPTNPLGLTAGVGSLSAGVTKSTIGNTSDGQLVGAGLGSLAQIPGLSAVTAPLQSGLSGAISQVINALQPLTSQSSQLPALPGISLPNPLAGLLPGQPATIDVPAIDLSSLGTTVNNLPATLNAVIDALLNKPLVDVDALHASQSNTPSGKGLVSTATAKLADIKLLGGLLLVKGITSTSTASATGVKGGATAKADATLVSVNVNTGAGSPLGDLLNAALSSQGLAADVLANTAVGSAVHSAADALNAAVSQLLAQINNLLSTLGVKIVQSDNTSSTTPDGKHAEAHASGATVSITLPIDTTPILALKLGASDAVADYEVQPTVTPATTTVVKHPTKKVTPAKHLAYTGSDPAIALLATGLLAAGAGVALRRRRTV